MPLLARGKINLYLFLKFSAYTIDKIYFAEKNDQSIEINHKTFKMLLQHLTFDSPDIEEKIGQKGYSFNDIIKIVKDYNRRFQ